MYTLNTMFKQKSNTMFNNFLFNNGMVLAMHPTMTRLYDYVARTKKVIGQSAVAKIMDEVPQTLNNWESRGISKQGLIKAQELFGCHMQWIKTGNGNESINNTITAKQDVMPYLVSTDGNVFETQLLNFYRRMSTKHKDAVFDLANKLYLIDNEKDKKANPYPTKPRKVKT